MTFACSLRIKIISFIASLVEVFFKNCLITKLNVFSSNWQHWLWHAVLGNSDLQFIFSLLKHYCLLSLVLIVETHPDRSESLLTTLISSWCQNILPGKYYGVILIGATQPDGFCFHYQSCFCDWKGICWQQSHTLLLLLSRIARNGHSHKGAWWTVSVGFIANLN